MSTTIPALVIAMCSIMAPGAASQAVAATGHRGNCIVCLGSPTNDLPGNYMIAGGFRHMRTGLRAGHKVEFLFLATAAALDANDAGERWPVLKALDQFGSFTGVGVAPQVCVGPAPGQTQKSCSVPTFDLSRARYTSRYLVFTHKDLLDARGRAYQRMSATEAKLFARYAEVRRAPSYIDTVTASVDAPGPRTLPLIVIGSYERAGAPNVTVGDFSQLVSANGLMSGLPFDIVHQALLTGKGHGHDSLVANVNGEANTLIAIICLQDGKRPGKVCDRPVIRTIVRHVR